MTSTTSPISNMDVTDGVTCVAHAFDSIDYGLIEPCRVSVVEDGMPERSELRVGHAQQDHPDGDGLGGTLVTYRHEQGYTIHRFEELGIHKKSLLRDSLFVMQNDQLVSLDDQSVNEMTHNEVVDLFFNLKIGHEHVMRVANQNVSTDSLRQMSFTLIGSITDSPEEKEEEPTDRIRPENVSLLTMPLPAFPQVEVTIALDKMPTYFLNKNLTFSRVSESDKSVHFIRDQSWTFVNTAAVRIITFRQKDTGFLAVDDRGHVIQLPYHHPNANLDATHNKWGSWFIESKRNGKFLAERNHRLVTVPVDKQGVFKIKAVGCKHCL